MSFRDHIRKLKPAKSYVSPLDKISDALSEALEYKGGDDEQFAVELVA